MRLLFVFHYCSPSINDIAWGPIHLASQGHDVMVLSSRHVHLLKGEHHAPEYEVIQNTQFYRPYAESTDLRRRPFAIWNTVRDKVAAFQPDAVIGFGEFAARLPIRISEHFQIPLFLYMENLRLEKIGIPIRGRTLLKKYAPWLLEAIASRFLRSLARSACGIMFAYHGDRHLVPQIEALGTRAFYVPWCSEIPPSSKSIARQRSSGIYVGSLEPFKNAHELIAALPLILEESATDTFTVIGPGSLSDRIKSLVKHYGRRLRYIPSLPRDEALDMIRAAGYGYTPVKDCGLGFIGDCWGTGTPLVTTHDLEGFLEPDVDALLVSDYRQLPSAIDELISSEAIFDRYSTGGLRRHSTNYTAAAVGNRYLEVIQQCIPPASPPISTELCE